MDKTEAKSVMVERYPDPSVEDPQLYEKLLTLPGDQVSWKEFLAMAMPIVMAMSMVMALMTGA